MENIKKDIMMLKVLTDRLVYSIGDNMGDTPIKASNNEYDELGGVTWCRVFKSDEQALEAICKRENRKKSQMIRVIVNEYLRRN